MSKDLIGQSVVFTGFTGDDMPDKGELLVEGETYVIDSLAESDEAGEGDEVGFYVLVDNPDFDPKKRKSKKANPEHILVDIFPEEFSIVTDDEVADEGEEDATETLDYSDVKKGMIITVDDGDEEGAITGEVVKALKTKLVVREGDEDVEIVVKDIVSIVAADAEGEADEPESQEEEEEAKPEKKAAAKKKAPAKKADTKKAPAKSKPAAKAKDEEEDEDLKGLIILSEDEEDSEILELVGEADDLCELAHDMAEESAAQDYRLGGVLYHVRVSKAYKELDSRYEEKGGFELYVQEKLGMGYRKAMYLVDIYTKFNKYGISGDKVAEIGWTKAQVIASAMEADNAEALVELAETSTVSDLKDTIKESYTKKGDDNREVVKRVSFKFRLLEDAGQVIRGYVEQAKDQLGVDKDDEVFEHIITEWAQEHLTKVESRKAGTTKAKASAKPAVKKKPAATK